MTADARLISEIEQDGRFIEAQLGKMRQCEAAAIEKAGPEIKRANDHWITIGQRLDAVKKKCKSAGQSFDEFKARYCPNLGRSKIYKLLAIADGRTTPDAERTKDAERQAKARSKTVRDVTDHPAVRDKDNPTTIKVNGQSVKADDFSPAARDKIIKALEETSPQESAEGRIAQYAAAEDQASTSTLDYRDDCPRRPGEL